MTRLASEVRQLEDEVLDRAHTWSERRASRLLDEAVRPLDQLLHELGVGDTFASVDDRTRIRLEGELERVRTAAAEVAEILADGPPRAIVERMHTLAVDLDMAERAAR